MNVNMIQAGILGSTGYVGGELTRILAAHPQVEIRALTSQSYIGKAYGEVYENFRHMDGLVCVEENIEALAEECDVIFIAMPHGAASQKVTEAILSKTKVIDMGADFRLNDPAEYEAWYKTVHHGKDLLPKAVYGLSEINRAEVGPASLVANPGCYPTCSVLALYPLLKEGIIDPGSIIIDAKSGVSGAGRGASLGTHFSEITENVRPYGVLNHRHVPEIEQSLSQIAGQTVNIVFTPNLVPMIRGMLACCYAGLKKKVDYAKLRDIYLDYYRDEYFVRLCKEGSFPETKWVKGSNFCDIGFAVDDRTGRIIVISAIDNLGKGAAGQGVQNMNIMFGLPETTGLTQLPIFPC